MAGHPRRTKTTQVSTLCARSQRQIRSPPESIENAFWPIQLDDISAIYRPHGLTFLRISAKAPQSNWQAPDNLRQVIEQQGRYSGRPGPADLTQVDLGRFKAGKISHFTCPPPDTWTELGLFSRNSQTLDGFCICPSVKILVNARYRNPQIPGDLMSRFPSLEHLVIQLCRRLTATEAQHARDRHQAITRTFAGQPLIIAPIRRAIGKYRRESGRLLLR